MTNITLLRIEAEGVANMIKWEKEALSLFDLGYHGLLRPDIARTKIVEDIGRLERNFTNMWSAITHNVDSGNVWEI